MLLWLDLLDKKNGMNIVCLLSLNINCQDFLDDHLDWFSFGGKLWETSQGTNETRFGDAVHHW